MRQIRTHQYKQVDNTVAMRGMNSNNNNDYDNNLFTQMQSIHFIQVMSIVGIMQSESHE